SEAPRRGGRDMADTTPDGGGGLTALGKLLTLVLVVGLIGLGYWVWQRSNDAKASAAHAAETAAAAAAAAAAHGAAAPTTAPAAARDAFASGDVQTLWGTVDMMVLFAPELSRDSRTAPRILQQIDWSNGGDGIVVRKAIKSAKDLKGKTVALAQNSPSEYYL